ncbi:MAG: hypothetical protein IPP72_18410 [Chitinophagaceae bacterium]|nr:hypothetical protein [Chitinophagaceae bacterium]
MNATHLHLLLNHFPVIGTLIGSGLLIWGIVKKQHYIKSAAAVLLAMMAIIAIPVYLTGEPAEESVEKLAGVSESMMELHEGAATIAIWLMGATGLASVIALFFQWQKSNKANRVYAMAFALSVICFAAMARTGYYGGQIRHSELSSGNTVNQQDQKTEGKEKDDD